MLVRHKKSSVALAKYLDVKTQTVSSWCTNTNQPSVETFFRISDFLGIEAGELLTPKKELKIVKTPLKKKAVVARKNKLKK